MVLNNKLGALALGRRAKNLLSHIRIPIDWDFLEVPETLENATPVTRIRARSRAVDSHEAFLFFLQFFHQPCLSSHRKNPNRQESKRLLLLLALFTGTVRSAVRDDIR